MKALIGLGNPGKKYVDTRHNAGFMFLDVLAESFGKTDWEYEKLLNSEIIASNGLILAKPQTFMNSSGAAVKQIIENWKLKIENLYIAHDDLDIRLGEYKIVLGKGPKVHKGIASIQASLKTHAFHRIRIGVDNRDREMRTPGEEYVLQNFTEREKEMLNEVIEVATAEIITRLK